MSAPRNLTTAAAAVALMGVLTLAGAPSVATSPARAQAADEAPASAAAAILDRLLQRTSLPPVEGRARLEVASPAVCRELGRRLLRLTPEQTIRVAPFLAESSNDNARAVLLYGMLSEDDEVRGAALRALTRLPHRVVPRMPEVMRELDASLSERLADAETWRIPIGDMINELCAQDRGAREQPDAMHRMWSLVLACDVFAGGPGFRFLVDDLVRNAVGEPYMDGEPDDPDADDADDDDADDDWFDESDPEEADALEAQRRLANARRRGARDMLRLLLRIDPLRFSLGLGTPYERRLEAGERFWKIYVECVGREATTWRQHLLWIQQRASGPLNEPSEDDSIMALILMDSFLGGVTIPAPPDPDSEDPDADPGEMPVLLGESDAAKLVSFKELPRRDRMNRTRAVQREFRRVFGVGD